MTKTHNNATTTTTESSAINWRAPKTQRKATSLRERVYRLLLVADMTGSEINKAMRSSSAHKRLSELLHVGAIEMRGRRICSVTRNVVTVWGAIQSMEALVNAPPLKPTGRQTTSNRKRKEEGFRQFTLVLQMAQLRLGYEVPEELQLLCQELRDRYG